MLGNVFITDIDGNISYNQVPDDSVTGLLFDVSAHATLFSAGYGKTNESKLKLNDVAYITSMKSAVQDFGIIERKPATVEEEDNVNFLHGIPAYHISEFFRNSGDAAGNGRLYVMFADCSSNWDAIETIQRASGGKIRQLGIFTEQPIWKTNGAEPLYSLNIVSAVNAKAEALAAQNMPLSIVLAPDCSSNGAIGVEGKQIDINMIPSCISECSRTSVIFGQARNETISLMQKRNSTNAPVGFLGAVMGSLAKANVHESISWIKKFNIFDQNFQNVEFGFGDTNLGADGGFVSTNVFESLSPVVLDDLDEKGYIFPRKVVGIENGVYISSSRTCSNGDFRNIERNRVINKSRRAVRTALLPSVNSPVMVNPSTGMISQAKITSFHNTVTDVLAGMLKSEEISGYKVSINPTQNVLTNDIVKIGYTIVPVGKSTGIYVEEGLALTSK